MYKLTLFEYKFHKRDGSESASVLATSILNALSKYKQQGGRIDEVRVLELCETHMTIQQSEEVVENSDYRRLISSLNL